MRERRGAGAGGGAKGTLGASTSNPGGQMASSLGAFSSLVFKFTLQALYEAHKYTERLFRKQDMVPPLKEEGVYVCEERTWCRRVEAGGDGGFAVEAGFSGVRHWRGSVKRRGAN